MTFQEIFGDKVPMANVRILDKDTYNVEKFLFGNKEKKKVDIDSLLFGKKKKSTKKSFNLFQSESNVKNIIKMDIGKITGISLSSKKSLFGVKKTDSKKLYTVPRFNVKNMLFTDNKRLSRIIGLRHDKYSRNDENSMLSPSLEIYDTDEYKKRPEDESVGSDLPESTPYYTPVIRNRTINVKEERKNQGVLGKAGKMLGGLVSSSIGKIKEQAAENQEKQQFHKMLRKSILSDLKKKELEKKYGKVIGKENTGKEYREKIKAQRDKINALKAAISTKGLSKEKKEELQDELQMAVEEMQAIKPSGTSSEGQLSESLRYWKLREAEKMFKKQEPGGLGKGVNAITGGLGGFASDTSAAFALAPVAQSFRVKELIGLPQTSFGFYEATGALRPKKSYGQVVMESIKRLPSQGNRLGGIPNFYSELGQTALPQQEQVSQTEPRQPIYEEPQQMQMPSTQPVQRQPMAGYEYSPYSKRPVQYVRGPYKKIRQSYQQPY